MALINCPDCGREISNNAIECIKCGCPILNKTTVTIKFPELQQVIKNCYVRHKGKDIVNCIAGETVTFNCSKSIDVEINMTGWFTPIKTTIVPGKKYIIRNHFVKKSIEECNYIIESNSQLSASKSNGIGSCLAIAAVIIGILLFLYGFGFRFVPFIFFSLIGE